MDGLSNLLGDREQKITIGGKAYTLTVATIGNLAERENYILSLRPDPMSILMRIPANCPEAVAKQVAERLVSEATRGRFVTFAEDQEFDRSLHGVSWSLWKRLQAHHPEIDSLEKAKGLVELAHREAMSTQLQAALDRAHERDILPNSDPSTTSQSQNGKTAPVADGFPGPR